ncbi:hypothetical protein [Methanobrevibacter sp. V74]|uniref:hypothetical protein n=1 Tax=Methanobrevibacter sp. V74 TaxID=3064279 RepID=UPI002735372F|nr:hypothetical protein [Methanobrevibacter sp. V74]
MLLKKSYECSDGSIQTCFATYTCKYCGKTFIKFENKKMYCSIECACKSTQDNKAKYQRKRRKLINSGELVSNETRKLGTIHFPEEIGDWVDELKRVKYAKRKAGII